jgi:hypothetical protein
MPFAIAFRDKPQARCTRDTPPYGNTKASLAAISRRVRSSSIRQTNANFRRSRVSGFMHGHDSGQESKLDTFIYFRSLISDATDAACAAAVHILMLDAGKRDFTAAAQRFLTDNVPLSFPKSFPPGILKTFPPP